MEKELKKKIQRIAKEKGISAEDVFDILFQKVSSHHIIEQCPLLKKEKIKKSPKGVRSKK